MPSNKSPRCSLFALMTQGKRFTHGRFKKEDFNRTFYLIDLPAMSPKVVVVALVM